MLAPFLTRRLLEFDRPVRHPWLSVPLACEEAERLEYQEDAVQVFMDSVAEAEYDD